MATNGSNQTKKTEITTDGSARQSRNQVGVTTDYPERQSRNQMNCRKELKRRKKTQRGKVAAKGNAEDHG
jgi:hypothetical protein